MSEPHTTEARPSLLRKLVAFVVLPSTISRFEEAYLKRMNWIALQFFLWHLPAFLLIAYLNDTGVLLTAGLTAATLIGPVAAYYTLKSPRGISLTFGFTAMCMGGILVHIGQGPVQIEMHFYFFSLLAMLALFGNPLAIVVAAGTVTVHHLVLWYFIPTSVFNYDAPIWVVLVHAAFVVLETFATCFIARNFFENVIGLEKKVEERTQVIARRNRDMRLVLDNVGEGLLTVDRSGVLSSEHSAIAAEWFGPIEAGTSFAKLLDNAGTGAGAWFELGWSEVVDGCMPVEVSIDQLPSNVRIGERRLKLAYTAIMDEADPATLEFVLIRVRDVTSEYASAEAEARQREMLVAFNWLLHDRAGFLEFFHEAGELVRGTVAPLSGDWTLAKRQIHTLKGNCGSFGLQTFAARCHEIEEHISAEDNTSARHGIEELKNAWIDWAETIGRLFGSEDQDSVTIGRDEFDAILQLVTSGAPRQEVAHALTDLRLEPTRARLERFAEQARALAATLGKGEIDVQLGDGGVRIERMRFGEFWAAFTHVVRNAIDHGIEEHSVRSEAGKPKRGVLELKTSRSETEFVVEIRDDGRGIDWDAVRTRAAALGFECESDEELSKAIFTDGLSTRDVVTEVSGRGIGLGAVRAACEQLAGRVEVESERGRGTAVRFVFPATCMADYPLAA